jgi:hypothetical protein
MNSTPSLLPLVASLREYVHDCPSLRRWKRDEKGGCARDCGNNNLANFSFDKNYGMSNAFQKIIQSP